MTSNLAIFFWLPLLSHLCQLQNYYHGVRVVHGFQPQPAVSTPTEKRADRPFIDRARDKLTQFGGQQLDETKKAPSTSLVLDANNIRGIGKFVWNPREIQQRIAECCRVFHVARSIIVWDHGSCKSAVPLNDDSLVLFSGLFHRADDVIVKEACRLSALYSNDDDDNNNHTGWESLAFVTNDGGLVSRLRQRCTEAWRSKSNNSSIGIQNPVIIDSTCFVELLTDLTADFKSPDFSAVDLACEEAQQSLHRFAVKQRRRLNPRREKTWQRCVLAESYQRALCQRYIQQDPIKNDSFASRYLQDLEERGYAGASDILQKPISDGVGGAVRLDKRQRRLLGRYNAFRKKEFEYLMSLRF